MGILRAAALLALILPAIPVAAKQPPVRVLSNQDALLCAPAKSEFGFLRQKYGEIPHWWGQTEEGAMLVLTQNQDTGTWTLMLVLHGEACMVSSGAAPDGAKS